MLVTGNTYRHPAVLANMVATLDHVSAGRAILGLGAAWHEAEHRMYGIPFDTAPIRLAKLRESTRIVRSLLRRERTTVAGKHYQVTDARLGVRPVQAELPILIGGGGEQVTLRITARYADIWHGFGAPDIVKRKIEVLRRHCEDVGRDPAAILPTTGGTILVRQSEEGLRDRLRQLQERHRHPAGSGPASPLPGIPDVDAWVERLHQHWLAGVRGFIFGMGAPFDRESAERLIGEVRPRLEALVSA